MNHNKVFIALSEEAAFTGQILKSGITQLAKANYAMRGLYFVAFSSVSLGIERLGKLCILLDYYIHNECKFPNEETIKKYGHDLNSLYLMSFEIAKRNAIEFEHPYPDTDIHKEIMRLLTAFAKGDRYANLNVLIRNSYHNDPISEWYENVDEPLYNLRVSKRKKEAIQSNAQITGMLAGPLFSVRHTGEDRKDIDSVEEGSLRTGKYEAVAKYRQLYVAQIIRHWTYLLEALADIARNLNSKEWDIPYLNEFFRIFGCPDSYLLTRKTYSD